MGAAALLEGHQDREQEQELIQRKLSKSHSGVRICGQPRYLILTLFENLGKPVGA